MKIQANNIPKLFATISFLLKYPFLALLSFISFNKPAEKLIEEDMGSAAFSFILSLFTRAYWVPNATNVLYRKCCALSTANHSSIWIFFLGFWDRVSCWLKEKFGKNKMRKMKYLFFKPIIFGKNEKVKKVSLD